MDKVNKRKLYLCIQLISEINISKYDQKEYVSIIKEIYSEIFRENFDTNNEYNFRNNFWPLYECKLTQGKK